MELVYFKEEEFRRATPSCSLSDMNEEFMKRLDECRDFAGTPFKINSVIASLLVCGFHRIGIGSNFIHVDTGYPNSTPIIWTY